MSEEVKLVVQTQLKVETKLTEVVFPVAHSFSATCTQTVLYGLYFKAFLHWLFCHLRWYK